MVKQIVTTFPTKSFPYPVNSFLVFTLLETQQKLPNFLPSSLFPLSLSRFLQPLQAWNHNHCSLSRAQWDFKNCLEELPHMFFNVKLNFKVGFFWNFFDLSTPWGRKMHICKCMRISMGKWPKNTIYYTSSPSRISILYLSLSYQVLRWPQHIQVSARVWGFVFHW